MKDTEFTAIVNYYDVEVVKKICSKYGLPELQALRRFLMSETYKMLRNPKLEMWEFSPLGIFDMWECEQVTGEPRTSLYIRRD